VNLGKAIQRAHDRKDLGRRNDLIRVALANGSSYRKIARLLKRSVSTVYSYLDLPVEHPDPLTLPVSTFESERRAA
jgi:DNA invertase Pin-like site-specific DNA recombinase